VRKLPDNALPRGARLAVDVGKARIGLAASDPDGLLAMPVETVARVSDRMVSTSATDRSADIAAIVAEATERSAAVIYVGLPRHLSGKESESTADARKFAARLAKTSQIPVYLVDERLTTVTATAQLHAAGRKAKRHRPVIDQAAAVIILQAALDQEKNSGQRAGEFVAGQEGVVA
jgi:putative holliday junction resolvase